MRSWIKRAPPRVLIGALAGLWVWGCSGSPAGPGPDNNRMPPQTPPPPLQPGDYASPLIHLQKLQGSITHLHVDEVRYRPEDQKLFQCAYTFAVVDAKDPSNLKYVVDGLTHKVPGDMRKPGCIHLAWDGNIIYTTQRGNIDNPAFLTAWDISNQDGKTPAVQLPALQEPDTSYEGVDVANGYIYVGLHDKGLGVYQRDPKTNAISRVGLATGLSNAWGVAAQKNSTTVYVADGLGGLAVVDVADPTMPRVLAEVAIGGMARGVVVDGSTAYVAAGSAGLQVVDVSSRSAPRVIGHADTPGTVLRVSFAANRVWIADWNDFRVYDVTSPAAPRFLAAGRITVEPMFGGTAGDTDVGRPDVTARTLGIAAAGDFAFVGNWYLLHSYRLHAERSAPSILLPEEVDLIDFGPTAAGAASTASLDVTNQGSAPLTLFDNWTEGSSFSVTPRQVQIAPGKSAALTLSYKATDGKQEKSALHIWSDDPDQPVRTAELVGNLNGLGIGKPLPQTRLALLDGNEWDSSQVQNKVLVLAYFATF